MLETICGLFGPPTPWTDDDSKLSRSTLSSAIPYADDEYVSPFIAYNDDYQWPDLYTELDECLESCILIYPLAELRRLAREGKLDRPEKILQVPLTHAEVMDFVIANQE